VGEPCCRCNMYVNVFYWHDHFTVCTSVRRKCILITVIVLRRNQPKFESSCSDQCVCDEELFSPICGDDGITYFSACHAGCRNRTSGKEYISGYKVPNILFVYLLRYYIGYIAIIDLCLSAQFRPRSIIIIFISCLPPSPSGFTPPP